MRIDVRLTPAAVRDGDVQGRAAVVIDVIRFSTSVLAALEAGAAGVLPAPTAGKAAALAGSLGRSDVLLCGELGGRKPEGFDLGNSPRGFTPGRVSGRTLVYGTTNGTRALHRVREARCVAVACLANLGGVAGRLRAWDRPALVVCAGREGKAGLDDVWCAGLLVDRLEDGGPVEMDDGARLAAGAARSLGRPDRDALATTAAGAALVEIGLGEDLQMCAAMDRTDAVPVLADGRLTLADAAG